jgi:hypothetical protein
LKEKTKERFTGENHIQNQIWNRAKQCIHVATDRNAKAKEEGSEIFQLNFFLKERTARATGKNSTLLHLRSIGKKRTGRHHL